MKKTIQTMVVSLMAVMVIATSAHASFNSPGSMPTVTVTNASVKPCAQGPIDGCWTRSTTARPGDVIAVHIYYKNTGSQPEQAYIDLEPSRSGANVQFSGGVNSAGGTATVTLSTPTTIAYLTGNDRACWTVEQGPCREVNADALFGSGFNIGVVQPGEQGTLVARFLVGAGQATNEPEQPEDRPQCDDDMDNDGDGRTDYPSDPGCSSYNDDNEYNSAPEVDECAINSFVADDYTIERGDSVRLTWNTTDCAYTRITSISGNLSPDGSYTVYPTATKTYTLTSYPDGDTRTVTIRVEEEEVVDDCEINSFTASDTTIREGDTITLRWTTTGCDYVNISSVGTHLSDDGSEIVRPTSDKTYTLTAYPGGDTATVRISVAEDTVSTDDECRIDEFKANRYTIERGSTATITWKVTDATRVEINGSSKNKSGSMSVSPISSTNYRIEVSGKGCSDSESFTISVNETQNAKPQAITTVASILSSTAAQLNGIAVPNTTSGSTTAWFEWGPSTNVQYRTTSKNVGNGASSIPYSDVVNGLVPGTTYYYRAVVQNQNGTAYGSIVNFRTQNIVAGSTVVTQPTRVIVQSQTIRDSVSAQSVASLLELRIESAYDHMCIGGEIEYVVTYRNISPVTLEDTVLRVALPKELTYVGADRGKYDPIDQILTLDIGRVQPGEQGSVTIRARVNENAIRGNLTVLTATVVYTNPNTRAQEDAIAYSLITVSDECPTVLGASVFGFTSFLPDTLLEWLLLILVILALILLGRNLYKKKEEQKA